ncbi:MAG: hypothetical protein ACI3XQ_07035 [Eubacteriales bacterium]
MLDKFQYKNHLNEVIEFGKDGIFSDLSNIRDYEWTITKKNERISSFYRSIRKITLPITIICDTAERGIAAKNRIFEVIEKDVIANRHGRLIVGDYYYRCFATKSQKKEYLTSDRYIKLSIVFSSDFPFWVRERTIHFFSTRSKRNPYNCTSDYPFDYSFDFDSGLTKTELYNDDFTSSNFRIVIYGETTNPSITIGGHVYNVNCAIGDGEYLTIDSVSKKIYLTGIDGSQENKFSSRNRNSYIFEKIPSGSNSISWNGEFGFDVVLLEERSEPKWI